MKKIIVMVCLVALMCFGFVGCKEEGSTTAPAETTAVAPAEEAAASAVEEADTAVEEAASAAPATH